MTLEFRIQHKYCGCERVITGENVYNAFKTNGIDLTVWTVIEVTEIDE